MKKKNAHHRKEKEMILSVLTFCIAYFLTLGTTIPTATNSSQTYEKNHVFYPTYDTTIDQTTPEQNYLNFSTLFISNTFGNNSSGWERDSLLYFNISELPTYTQINAATLYLYYSGYEETDPVNRVLSLHQITGDWNKNNVTWKTRPTTATNNISFAYVPQTTGWMSWDVTTDAQRIINNPSANHGWQLSDKNPWRHHNIPIVKFKSKETQTTCKPYLDIQYTIPLIVSTNGPYEGYIYENITINSTIIDGGTPPYDYSWDFGDGTTSSDRNTIHSYTKAGCYSLRLTVHDSAAKTASTTTSIIIKTNKPSISIQQPQNGFYCANKKIISLQKTWILGPLDIHVETSSLYPITKVKFLIDNQIQQIDTTSPYTWTWNQETRPGKHTLKVIVVDETEGSAVDQLTVWKLL